jgi:UPF0755 protein
MTISKRLKNTAFVIAVLFSALFIGGALFVWQSIENVKGVTLDISQPLTVEIKRGSSLYAVKRQLSQHANIDSLGFKLWARFHPEYNIVQAGLYEIPVNTRFVDALKMMRFGEVKQFSITLIEGQTWSQWYQILQQHPDLNNDLGDLESVYAALIRSDDAFCANQYASLEGCLLPDTYNFTHQSSAFSLVKRAYGAMHNSVDEKWNNRFADIPLKSAYEMLILASIIEKETALESEREEIAGVFVNRLNQNMRLQTDPTVIYGIGESYDGDITRKHLRTPTPYNTYVIKGLPITPIAMPSLASIHAASRPALTDSLYFVASGEGGHQFSTNLADHNRAVRRYLDKLKQNRNND